MEGPDPFIPGQDPTVADARRHPRFKLDIEIRVYSRTAGLLKGRTLDISESGIAALLKLEAPIGEIVQLEFTLPLGPISVQALVRQKNAFRYGLQFIDSEPGRERIRQTCRQFSVEQSLSTQPGPAPRRNLS